MSTSLPYKRIYLGATILLAGFGGFAQTDTTAKALENLSLKDLLNIKVVSVSKRAELLFDAPLSATVVTREEIRRAGSTSIMEALRLVPGMIVREQTNGNYDIYLRGMDNVPPNGSFEGNSTTTLVMINNRPIYNYLKGGTFWETLPIDINDVEKIEVVRGPAAALYGPNAVSGVINIITRETEKDGLHLVINNRQGSQGTIINNASIGYQFNKKWNLLASGNYQQRNRSQTSYYEMARNEYLEDPEYLITYLGDTVRGLQAVYPHPLLAMKKYAGNLFVNFHPADKITFGLSAGAQHSLVQKVSTENGSTPLTTVGSNTRYADLHAHIKGLSAQFSWIDGTQVPDHQPGNKYDFHTADISIEYNYTSNRLTLKPGFSYRSAVYDDREYVNLAVRNGIFNARGQLTTTSGSLRGEYKMLRNRMRLVAGIMANKFNYPDTTYLSYELAATYKLSKKHLVRAVFSSAPRSSAIYDPYVNQQIGYYPIGIKKYLLAQLEAKKDLKLLTASMFELGYRGNLSARMNVDVEFFLIHSRNYNSLLPNDVYVQMKGEDTVVISPYRATNLPLHLQQHGVTVSLNYSTAQWQVKPFITLQQSTLKNYTSYTNTAGALPTQANPNPAANNIYSGMGTSTDAEGTPDVLAGAFVNFIPSSKWNINLNAYYYTKQVYRHGSFNAYNDGVRGIDHIPAKLLLNANLSYEVIKGLRLSCTAKNILSNDSREFFKSDAVPFMILGGIHYDL